MDHTRNEGLVWRPVREGVTLAPLNMTAGAGSFLMRFEPGSRSPAHDHPGGEEIYVVQGSGRLNDIAFGPGDYIFTPPGEGHTLHADDTVVIHVNLPQAVVITE
ncbi:cupin domain-containing protein [Caulobacter sp. KR2-114]|uniref:cupin domain-containing protein n=1 Tax=Caulobacter sp. KR2-114 TaxID=3400912 RepID=UPI003C11B5B2